MEALLAEDGGEPRLRIWLYEKEKALASSAAKVSATVTRLTGEKQALNFTLAPGATATFRYLLRLLPGPFSRRRAEQAAAGFVK